MEAHPSNSDQHQLHGYHNFGQKPLYFHDVELNIGFQGQAYCCQSLNTRSCFFRIRMADPPG